MSTRPATALAFGLSILAGSTLLAQPAVRLVGTVPEGNDPPVLLVPAPDPLAVLDLRYADPRVVADMLDAGGVRLGPSLAFAIEARRAQLGTGIREADLAALAGGLAAGEANRLGEAHRLLLARAFGTRAPEEAFFMFRAVVRWLEGNGEAAGESSGAQAVRPALPLYRDGIDGEALRRFLHSAAQDPLLMEALASQRAGEADPPAAGLPPPAPRPDGPGFEGLEGGGVPVHSVDFADPAPAAVEALARAYEAELGRGAGPGQAQRTVAQALAAGGTAPTGPFATLSRSGRLFARGLAEALADGQRAVRAGVLVRSPVSTLIVVDLNKASREMLARAGVPEAGIREILARQGRIETLGAVSAAVGPAALQASKERFRILGGEQAGELARTVYDGLDDRDPFVRQAQPLSPDEARRRLGNLASPSALQGGGGQFVGLEGVPYPVYVRTDNGRVVGMTPASRDGQGTMVARDNTGAEVARRPATQAEAARYVVLEPIAGGAHRRVPVGDPQRAAMDEAFRIPFLAADLDLIAIHRGGLLREGPPQGGVSGEVRRVALSSPVFVVLQGASGIHSTADTIVVREADGYQTRYAWMPRVAVPLRSAALFQAKKDGELPLLLTHELAHVAMFDRWQGLSQQYRFQPRSHGEIDDYFLSCRQNALTEGWAESWAIVMGRDPGVARAYQRDNRWNFHRRIDRGFGLTGPNGKLLDGHSLLAHEYAVANAFADLLASREWTASQGGDLAGLLPAGMRLTPKANGCFDFRLEGGAFTGTLHPHHVSRLRALKAFRNAPRDMLAWIGNALQDDPARGRRAGAEFLASCRYQPLAARGGVVGGALLNQEVDAATRAREDARVLGGQVPAQGPWPRVGPELFVWSGLQGIKEDDRAMDLNRHDDPVYARVLGLTAQEHAAIVGAREARGPFPNLQAALAAFPPRHRTWLTQGREEYRRRYPRGP